MAKYYGRESGYLKKKKLRFRIAFLVTVAAVLALAYKIATMDTAEYWWLIAALLLLAIYPLIVVNEKYNLSAFLVNRGLTGESVIREELLKLPNDYSVFEDMTFSRQRGNIDFVVTGPTGIFAIEVKSHRGSVAFHGGRIYVNNYPKNFLVQTLAEQRALSEFFRQRKLETEVVPVLVFSGRSNLRFGFEKQGGVYVFGRDYLVELIAGGHAHHNKDYGKATDLLTEHYLTSHGTNL